MPSGLGGWPSVPATTTHSRFALPQSLFRREAGQTGGAQSEVLVIDRPRTLTAGLVGRCEVDKAGNNQMSVCCVFMSTMGARCKGRVRRDACDAYLSIRVYPLANSRRIGPRDLLVNGSWRSLGVLMRRLARFICGTVV